jgi:hypothetical protein
VACRFGSTSALQVSMLRTKRARQRRLKNQIEAMRLRSKPGASSAVRLTHQKWST